MREQDIPAHLHERYGIRPHPWRWVALGVAAAIMVPVGVYAATRYVASQRVPFALITWAAVDDTRVRVTWKMNPDPHRQWCALRAQDFDHFDVGFAVVPVEAGERAAAYTMHTSARPLAVDVMECSVDPYALSGPQFRPGARPPAQPAPGLAPGVHATVELGRLQ